MEGFSRVVSSVILFSAFANGLELLSITESPQTVVAGESLRISCKADSSWQWCYWTNVDDNRRYHSSQGAASNATLDPRIQFYLDDHSCGLVVKNVSKEDSGTWKCHLANTDYDDPAGIKVEEFVRVRVATVAEVIFSPIISHKVGIGERIDLKCSLMDSDIFPPATISVYQAKEVEEGYMEDPVRLVNGTAGSVEFVKTVTMLDNYATFFCESTQVMDGESLFKVSSSMSKNSTWFFLQCPSEVSWDVLDEEGSTIYPLTTLSGHAKDSNPGKLFLGSPVMKTAAPDQYYVSLTMWNMTQNATAAVTVSNEHGVLRKEFPIVYTPPSLTSPSPPDEVQQAGLSIFVILGVVALVIVIGLVVLFTTCATRSISMTSKRQDEVFLEDAAANKKTPLLEKEESFSLKQPPSDVREARNEKVKEVDGDKGAGASATHFRATAAYPVAVDDDDKQSKIDETPPVTPQFLADGGTKLTEAKQLPKPSQPMSHTVRYRELATVSNVSPSPPRAPIVPAAATPAATRDVANYPPALELQLRRQIDPNLSVGEDDFEMSGHSRGTLLRLSGPTNYPVFATTPVNFFPSPSTLGRRTNQMNFMRPDA